MKPQPTLTTKRLILRPFVLSDAKRVQELAGDPAIPDTALNIPHPYEDGIAEDWIESQPAGWELDQQATFAISLTVTGEVVGAIGLNIERENDSAELGYWIGKPYWGNGYATEAVREIIRFGLLKMKLNRIFAHHIGRNPASGRVMQKAGMKFEGTLRQAEMFKGKYEDLVVYSILRDELEYQ